MSVLKDLKLQHVSIIIQIIFKELVGSFLKSLNLKVFKIVKVNCGDAAVSPQLAYELPEDDLNYDRNMLERF